MKGDNVTHLHTCPAHSNESSRTHFGVNETTEALGGGAPMLTQTHNSLKYNNHDNRPLSWLVFLNAFACFLAEINLSVNFSSQPREIISC